MPNVAVDAATGEPLVTSRSSAFIRGEGGFGGERGTDAPWERATPPAVVETDPGTWIDVARYRDRVGDHMLLRQITDKSFMPAREERS